MTRRRASALLAVLLLVTGCAAASPVRPAATPGTGVTDGHPWVFRGSVTAVQRWGGDGVVVDPVPAGEPPPVIDAAGAVTLCDLCGGAGAAITVSLGLATTPSAGDVDARGRIVRRTLDRTLVYQLVTTGQPCAAAGPVGLAHRTTTCTEVSFVDARDGTVRYGYSFAEH